MAKTILSYASDQRGSIGGTVFSKNRFGAYVRGRVAPVQPRTPTQTNIRALLSTAARSWRTIPQADQQVWRTVASGVTLVDSMGVGYNPSGFQLFMRSQLNYWLLGLLTPPTISLPPTSYSTPDAPTGIVLAPIAGPPSHTLGLSWTTPAVAAFSMLVFATRPLSAGISFIKASDYRLISGVQDSSVTQPMSLDAAYIAVFGALPSSFTKVGIRIIPVRSDTRTGFSGADGRLLYQLP